MTSTTDSPATAQPPEPTAPKKRRGRETTADMVRSLGLVLLVVVPIWYFAQPPDTDVQELRVVDQAPDVRAWTASADPAPVPGRLPAGWRATVSEYEPEPVGLRLGWNTPDGHYAEFAATTGLADPFVRDLAGSAAPAGTVDVDGAAWQRYRESDGSISLVRAYGDVTVVIGTRRATASLDDLVVVARSVRPGA